MKPQSIVLAMALFASCAPLYSQVPPGVPQDYLAMAQAMEKAQAEASRPGDQQLTCEQLQEQLIAVVQDPALQAHMQTMGVAAEEDMAKVQASQGTIAARSAATMIAATVPGAAMGHMAASAAENQAKIAEAAQRMQARMAQARQMTAFMPQMLRGQRLIELGLTRKCEWTAGAGGPESPNW